MEHSLSSEAHSCSASLEIPCFLWKSKVHCHVHKNLPLDPIVKTLSLLFGLKVRGGTTKA